jgi:hypothetical protein
VSVQRLPVENLRLPRGLDLDRACWIRQHDLAIVQLKPEHVLEQSEPEDS